MSRYIKSRKHAVAPLAALAASLTFPVAHAADAPATVERFEAYVLGMELCNAFTELNDPEDQEARFLEMLRDYAADDEERHPLDEDYLRAMRYGMPHNGGFGMGVDRLTMLLTDKHSIRDVLLFPHMRSDESGGADSEK